MLPNQTGSSATLSNLIIYTKNSNREIKVRKIFTSVVKVLIQKVDKTKQFNDL